MSSYYSKLIIDHNFSTLEVNQKDSVIFRPETFIHINYTYNGAPACKGENYQDAPDISLTSQKSYVQIRKFSNSDILWLHPEQQFVISGTTPGRDTLILQAEWTTEDQTGFPHDSRTFKIPVLVNK